MRRVAAMALIVAVLVSAVPSGAQDQSQGTQKQSQAQPSGKKLEALFTAAEMPFTRTEDGRYIAVITVENNESERFYVSLDALGDDVNNEKLQYISMDFLLGQFPKGATPSTAFIKQMAQWNANLTFGKVIVVGNAVVYTTTTWLAHTDAETLGLDAALGHYVSQDLRKEVTPYLKQ